MSKDIQVRIDGETTTYTDIDVVRANLARDTDWVPENEGSEYMYGRINGVNYRIAKDKDGYITMEEGEKPENEYPFSVTFGGVERMFDAQKLQIVKTDSSMSVWVPKPEQEAEAFSGILVNEDDEERDYGVKKNSNGTVSLFELPVEIRIITPPVRLDYSDGDVIDYSRMVVTAYNEDGSVWTDQNHPNGIIPLDELMMDSVFSYDDSCVSLKEFYDGSKYDKILEASDNFKMTPSIMCYYGALLTPYPGSTFYEYYGRELNYNIHDGKCAVWVLQWKETSRNNYHYEYPGGHPYGSEYTAFGLDLVVANGTLTINNIYTSYANPQKDIRTRSDTTETFNTTDPNYGFSFTHYGKTVYVMCGDNVVPASDSGSYYPGIPRMYTQPSMINTLKDRIGDELNCISNGINRGRSVSGNYNTYERFLKPRIAWAMIYGGRSLEISWSRPNDGKILKTHQTINVME